ncbi:PAS domain-containing protein [Mucilaginibacter flavus]|uniref:PAS domain-containing protein n=1 Tax=Mucilaginibacter flavus TaxID=931504 RepID=UPI0025B4820E|nr:PAS domain-containing protein [Mucilaginibacter flavus]MDN3582717.1 PAS domain-containing protein [Mucilaginibacter flavus]
MHKLWQNYKALINRNCLGNTEQLHGLLYWSNRLFAAIMTYLFPFFVIALIPGEYMSITTGLYPLAIFDFLIVIAITLVALLPGISIPARKSLLIALLYMLGTFLLYYLGWYGPGLLYLLAITFFSLLIFHGKHPFATLYINVLICFSIGVCIHFKLLATGIGLQYTLGSWIAVSINLIILSATISILLPALFNGLQHSNNRYEAVAKATSDTIWDWDIVNDTIQYNYGMNKVFGYKLNEVANVKHWWNSKLHPTDVANVAGALVEAFESDDNNLQLEYRFLCADGQYKYIFDRAFIIRNTDGDPIRMVGAMQDITRRKQEEQWLRLTESALKYATDAVLIVEAEKNEQQQRKILYVNEAFTHITGYSQQETVGVFTDVVWGNTGNELKGDDLLVTFEQNDAFEVEVINHKKNGDRFWSSKSISPVKDTTGKITHWISIERDVTQTKNYVEAIEKQNIKLKEIAWTQAHIVRTPVARLKGLLNLLKEEASLPDENAEVLKFIDLSVNELDAIIYDIIKKSEKEQINLMHQLSNLKGKV